MSKEIAQTVGGKRIAWLIAIVAVFAVFATLTSQWRGASAAPGDLPNTTGDIDQTPNGSGTAAPGEDLNYIVSGTINVPLTVDDSLVVGLNLDADFVVDSVVCTVPIAATVVDGTGPAVAGMWTPGAGLALPAGTYSCNVQGHNDGTGNISPPQGFIFADINENFGRDAGEDGSFSDINTTDWTSDAGTITIDVGELMTLTPISATNVVGVAETFTFGLGASSEGFVTCASDADLDDTDVDCTAADVNLTGGCTIDSFSVVGDDVLVTIVNSVASVCTVSLDLKTVDAAGVTIVTFESLIGTKTYVDAELRNMSDVANTVLADQEFNWNVRGSRHTICTVAQNTGIDGADADNLADDPLPTAVQIPGITAANIFITNGGGYLSTADTDPDFTDVRVFVGDGTETGLPTSTVTAGLAGATCISWVSTDAGDQQITLVFVGEDGLSHTVSWDTDDNGNGAPGNGETGGVNTALVKEWNRLEDSVITLTGGATGTATGNQLTPLLTRTINVVLNPATGLFQFTAVNLDDIFRGSHTNSAGAKEGPRALAGVNVSVKIAGCGELNGDIVTVTGVTAVDAEGNVILVDANGDPLSIFFDEGDSAVNCGPGQTATITFTGSEPGPLGSGTGITVTEIIVFNFAQNIAEKKVWLAWAGQRIIVEHDWRLAPGDFGPARVDSGDATGSPTPNGTCPFAGDFIVQHIKGTGPGNFVPGLNVFVDGADQAFAIVGASDNSQTLQTLNAEDPDIILQPQDNCISRVLYESEDPGEVDLEAFVVIDEGGILQPRLLQGQQIEDQIFTVNSTKVAFVIYYMKINTISISLASQFEKPSHNDGVDLPDWTSGAAGARTAPVNPWNAALDDADNAVDWNVSKDILVRGRVTGWFTNSNPSGRAADTTNPLNVLPANRWVMPQDWPLLAGGPADPADGTDAIGTAEQFRPYYDIMFAPNNARGLNLSTPEGAVATQATFVATGNTGIGSVASPIRVVSCADLALLAAGANISVGATAKVFTSCAGTSLVITVPFAAAPAAGTGVFIPSGAPFEGPYSTIDIVGLASQGLGGAALSNFLVGNIRDTTLDDGDVDWFDAPMPSTHVSVAIRGTGFIKEVLKDEVYYLGTPNNAAAQIYTNPYYITNIPGSPFIPAVVAGGGYLWNSWGLDGPGGNGQGVYRFWQPVLVGTNSEGIGEGLSAADQLELGLIRTYTGDTSIARDLVVYTDNHGEFMVAANGDFKTDLTACATNVLAGGKHCKPGDKVGVGTITATVDYPDFRGKHFPVLSNSAAVTWLWGGYKDVTVEDGETDQFKYIVFHAMDRDGFCSAASTGADLLHSVLGRDSALGMDDTDTDFTIANLGGSAAATAGGRYNNDPDEAVDFLIDSGEGIIIGSSGPGLIGGVSTGAIINDGKQFATGIPTFSLLENDPATTGILEFPVSSLAGAGQVDECQAWIKVSNSLLGVLNVLAIAKDDEGNIGFDRIIDLTNTTSYTLNFRWSLITWAGADDISVNDAIKGTGTSGKNPGGNDISASVTAIYGWDAAAQQWLGFFPSGVNVPGANDLTVLKTGQAYWIAITGPSSVTWTIASNVN